MKLNSLGNDRHVGNCSPISSHFISRCVHRRIASEPAADLALEKRTAELRDQFIAVLGQRSQNPLASISAGARPLQREEARCGKQQPPGLMRRKTSPAWPPSSTMCSIWRAAVSVRAGLVRCWVMLPWNLYPPGNVELQAGYPARTIEAHIARRVSKSAATAAGSGIALQSHRQC